MRLIDHCTNYCGIATALTTVEMLFDAEQTGIARLDTTPAAHRKLPVLVITKDRHNCLQWVAEAAQQHINVHIVEVEVVKKVC